MGSSESVDPLANSSSSRTEFGDFQTPIPLARAICEALAADGLHPKSVAEPTCGTGTFLVAALDAFPTIEVAVGSDINIEYLEIARSNTAPHASTAEIRLFPSDIFTYDWPTVLASLPQPILVLGNPPWVTNTRLSTLSSPNIPAKSNFQNLTGIEARTGKSNFDISEWILIQFLSRLPLLDGHLAMLCKTSVARRALLHCWRTALPLLSYSITDIDARKHFAVAADACLLRAASAPQGPVFRCAHYPSLGTTTPTFLIGFAEGRLIADFDTYSELRHLHGEDMFRWRSGIKHDAARVMELTSEGNTLKNSLGEIVAIEDKYLYPMLKSSDLARFPANIPPRWMLVPQHRVAADTGAITHHAPKTWKYLQSHADILDARKSSIYAKAPRFSIFGVGDYTFKPWKVAISGLYRSFSFRLVPPIRGRPVVFDDTCYFLSWDTEEQATYTHSMLMTTHAQRFLNSLVFWDAKRPITADLLESLNIQALAAHLPQPYHNIALLQPPEQLSQPRLLERPD